MIRPLREHIAVRPHKPARSALLYTPADKDKPELGEVIAAGPDCANWRSLNGPLKVGDTVRFGAFSFPTFRLSYQGEELLMLSAKDVVGVVA